MSEPEKTIHVSPNGESWDVETETSSVAQTETREQAIEAARENAAETNASSIVVHNSDGSIQEQVSLPVVKNETAE
jgi:predicted TIM-barrel fold metal-dependent hydrolase